MTCQIISRPAARLQPAVTALIKVPFQHRGDVRRQAPKGLGLMVRPGAATYGIAIQSSLGNTYSSMLQSKRPLVRASPIKKNSVASKRSRKTIIPVKVPMVIAGSRAARGSKTVRASASSHSRGSVPSAPSLSYHSTAAPTWVPYLMVASSSGQRTH